MSFAAPTPLRAAQVVGHADVAHAPGLEGHCVSKQFDTPVPGGHQLNDAIDQRLKPCGQCWASNVTDADPHHHGRTRR